MGCGNHRLKEQEAIFLQVKKDYFRYLEKLSIIEEKLNKKIQDMIEFSYDEDSLFKTIEKVFQENIYIESVDYSKELSEDIITKYDIEICFLYEYSKSILIRSMFLNSNYSFLNFNSVIKFSNNISKANEILDKFAENNINILKLKLIESSELFTLEFCIDLLLFDKNFKVDTFELEIIDEILYDNEDFSFCIFKLAKFLAVSNVKNVFIFLNHNKSTRNNQYNLDNIFPIFEAVINNTQINRFHIIKIGYYGNSDKSFSKHMLISLQKKLRNSNLESFQISGFYFNKEEEINYLFNSIAKSKIKVFIICLPEGQNIKFSVVKSYFFKSSIKLLFLSMENLKKNELDNLDIEPIIFCFTNEDLNKYINI